MPASRVGLFSGRFTLFQPPLSYFCQQPPLLAVDVAVAARVDVAAAGADDAESAPGPRWVMAAPPSLLRDARGVARPVVRDARLWAHWSPRCTEL